MPVGQKHHHFHIFSSEAKEALWLFIVEIQVCLLLGKIKMQKSTFTERDWEFVSHNTVLYWIIFCRISVSLPSFSPSFLSFSLPSSHHQPHFLSFFGHTWGSLDSWRDQTGAPSSNSRFLFCPSLRLTSQAFIFCFSPRWSILRMIQIVPNLDSWTNGEVQQLVEIFGSFLEADVSWPPKQENRMHTPGVALPGLELLLWMAGVRICGLFFFLILSKLEELGRGKEEIGLFSWGQSGDREGLAVPRGVSFSRGHYHRGHYYHFSRVRRWRGQVHRCIPEHIWDSIWGPRGYLGEHFKET